jgi:ABC-type transport system involved in multi-copper enzyme maturation permease subunit
MVGGSLPEIFPNVMALIIWAVAFFLIGIYRFKNRFN